MTARFLFPLSAERATILCIPGGPGLGSSYLDPFMVELAKSADVNAGILDLPNHGASLVRPERLPLSYEDCIRLVHSAVAEIAHATGALFLFGQSFGARVAFDLLPSLPGLRGAILAGFPYVFQMSDSMLERIGALDLEPLDNDPDGAFARNWKKIFPLYTTEPLPMPVAAALAAGTRWVGNERMLENVPAIEPIARNLSQLAPAIPLLILQGESDAVVPDGNWETLRELVPAARFAMINGAGHFPMVEKPEATLSEFTRSLSDWSGKR
jgi:pimeloyl-ACP methyl ester carboxylesterase